ncbi:amidohydrolase family protein, partial [Myxococcota bacterium]|nr:amidohydrolase family protein [Myxococcota bacterium]
LISVEQAVSCLTDQPARLLGLRERGRLELGWHADLVVFDPARVASGKVHVRRDLPAGAERLYADAIGIEHVLVAGTPIIRGGKETGATPGTILHSGRDTESVSLGRR